MIQMRSVSMSKLSDGKWTALCSYENCILFQIFSAIVQTKLLMKQYLKTRLPDTTSWFFRLSRKGLLVSKFVVILCIWFGWTSFTKYTIFSWFELFNYIKRNNLFNLLLDVVGRILIVIQQQLDLVADLTLVVLEKEIVWLSRKKTKNLKTWLWWRRLRALTWTGGSHLPVSTLLHDSQWHPKMIISSSNSK